MQRMEASKAARSYRGTTLIAGLPRGNLSGTGKAARAVLIKAYARPTPMALVAASPDPSSRRIRSS